MKRNLQVFAVILGLALTLGSIAKTYLLTPVQMKVEALEVRQADQRADLKAVQAVTEQTKEMLGRIDERTKNTDATVQKIEQRLR